MWPEAPFPTKEITIVIESLWQKWCCHKMAGDEENEENSRGDEGEGEKAGHEAHQASGAQVEDNPMQQPQPQSQSQQPFFEMGGSFSTP